MWRAMAEALREAHAARSAGALPIGAVVTIDGHIVGRGGNAIHGDRSYLHHAEMVALDAAAAALWAHIGRPGAALVTTLEPCHMCLMAAVNCGIDEIRYAVPDRRGGATSLAAEVLRFYDDRAVPRIVRESCPEADALAAQHDRNRGRRRER